jgi:GNAT superfamily N-acetyltransferase
MIDSEAYFAASQKIVSNILHRIDAIVRVAVLSDDHDVVLGFSVSRGNILDYVYVHVDQRRMGIGTNLLPKGIDTVSHMTNTGLTIWKGKYKEWKFDPFN